MGAGRIILGAVLILSSSPAGAEILCTSSKEAIVREGPGAQYPIAWTVDRHTPFEVLAWEGGWAKVEDFEGDEGWSHRSVLSAGTCAVVTGKRANVRSGPGLEHELLWELGRAYPFKVLGRRGDWLQVSDEDEVEGWIFIKLAWGNIPREFPGES